MHGNNKKIGISSCTWYYNRANQNGKSKHGSPFPPHLALCGLAFLPVSFWAPLLDVLPFGPPLAAHTVVALRAGDLLGLQPLGWLFEGELHGLALLQAAEALHVQLALKGYKIQSSGQPPSNVHCNPWNYLQHQPRRALCENTNVISWNRYFCYQLPRTKSV